jgi:major membrane immunogen (membrane-anchored lipoprotein)
MLCRFTVLAGLIVLSIVVGACGSSSKSSSPSTAGGATDTTATGHGATSDVCAQADDLKTSIGDLKDVNVVQNGVSSVRSALDKIKSDANALAESTKDEFKPQVTALQNALRSLADAVKNITSTGTSGVTDAAKSVESAATTLSDKVKSTKC